MDGLPDQDRLDELETRVLQRIRRRAEVRARVASGVAVAALLVGAVVLVRPAIVQTSGSSSGSAGSAASAAVLVHCHAASGAHSPSTTVPLHGPDTARSAVATCAEADTATASGGSTALSARAPVVCRTGRGDFAVFPADRHPATLCTRNGLVPG